MSARQLYDQWSSTYDDIENKTRDLEKSAGQEVLEGIPSEVVIELGCGTGKNTEWLSKRSTHLVAVDISTQMMTKARQKIKSDHVVFQEADITKPWRFTKQAADLITCSLILEHIRDLAPVFRQVADHLKPGGHFYACELHPFKQYSGSKARFETNNGIQVLECFVHHISDFLAAAAESHLSLVRLDEWFDNDNRTGLPRLISFLFRK